jgi:hypothetical protein
MIHRRQKHQLFFAGVLAAIALINILFFLILLRPVRSDYFNLQGSIDQLRGQVGASRQTVLRLEKTSDQLEKFEQDRQGLFATHFIKFDPGFAELSPRLKQLAVQSGVLRPVVDYSREEIKQYGLFSVKINIPVVGTYSNAVNFIKTLETSDTFFLIDSIGVHSSSESGATSVPGSVALALSLETYFYK